MVKDANDFAKAGNMYEAIGDATKEQRKQMERLSHDLASRYDAGGATGIMKTAVELQKAGFTFEQVIGSLEQTLATAALAGDMAAADVGAAISKSLIQFQMPMTTSEQMAASAKKVSDRMVYAAVSTVASTRDMAEAFKYVGGVSAATGNSLDATTAAIMGFARAGVLGSEAGVALRSAIVRLVKMPKGGLAALDRIGMKLGDYTSAKPVTATGVVSGLQASGIDASKIASEIASIIKAQAGQGPVALSAAITKAVQSHLGSTSAIDASTIAESVTAAITAAGSKVDVTRFFTDLKAKFDAGAATMGDIAAILEARHISRYMSLLKTDLPALIDQIGRESDGYAKARYEIASQGLPAALLKLEAAYRGFRNTVVETVTPELVSMFERIGGALKNMAATSPALLKLGVGLTVAATAAGPLLFVLSSIGRLGAGIFLGVVAGARGLTFVLATAAVGARALAVGLVAGLAGAAVQLRALAAGVFLLGATGGVSGVLAALGGSLLAFGRTILTFPIVLLRGIGTAMWALVANPVGAAITAVVVALTALGVWVYNNWDGIKSFFEGFGEGFMRGLGPAADSIRAIGSGLQSAFDWLGKLLRPIGATNEQWKGWGATLGGVVAAGVRNVISGIQTLIGFLGTVIDKTIGAGNAIRGMFSSGKGPVSVAPAAPLAGARAWGGPVSFGKPYLVGERGPEIFVPGASGRIETNDTLRRLTAAGMSAVAQSPTYNTQTAHGNSTIAPTFNIYGATDPDAVTRQIDSYMQRLQNEQRSLLSD